MVDSDRDSELDPPESESARYCCQVEFRRDKSLAIYFFRVQTEWHFLKLIVRARGWFPRLRCCKTRPRATRAGSQQWLQHTHVTHCQRCGEVLVAIIEKEQPICAHRGDGIATPSRAINYRYSPFIDSDEVQFKNDSPAPTIWGGGDPRGVLLRLRAVWGSAIARHSGCKVYWGFLSHRGYLQLVYT